MQQDERSSQVMYIEYHYFIIISIPL